MPFVKVKELRGTGGRKKGTLKLVSNNDVRAS